MHTIFVCFAKGKEHFPKRFFLALCKQIVAKHGTVTKNFSHRVSCHNSPDGLMAAAYISRHHIAPCPKKRYHVPYKKRPNDKESVPVVWRV